MNVRIYNNIIRSGACVKQSSSGLTLVIALVVTGYPVWYYSYLQYNLARRSLTPPPPHTSKRSDSMCALKRILTVRLQYYRRPFPKPESPISIKVRRIAAARTGHNAIITMWYDNKHCSRLVQRLWRVNEDVRSRSIEKRQRWKTLVFNRNGYTTV